MLNDHVFADFLSVSLEGDQVHALCIDFFKAFDSVNHQLLLHKLSVAGIEGPLLQWLCILLIVCVEILSDLGADPF